MPIGSIQPDSEAVVGSILKAAWLRRGAALVLALGLAVLLMGPLALRGADAPRPQDAAVLDPQPAVQIQAADPSDAAGPVLKVGLHLHNIYDLSLVNQSFLAEGWYWLDWGDDVALLLQRKGLEPKDLVEFANEIELGQYSSREASAVAPNLLQPGHHGLLVRFSGKFYVQDVPQRYAPFDPQRLTLVLEVKDENLAIGSDRLRLEPAVPVAEVIGEHLDLSGYVLHSVAWQRSQTVYPKDFLPNMRFSRLSVVLVYGKNEWAMFLKWIFPVLIVMAIVIVSPSIEGVLGDIRIAIPPSALLTLVVMQDSYKNSFPPAPYLTYLDEIYVYSYIVCLAIFLLFLVGTNLVARAEESERERVGRRVNRIDGCVQVSMVIGFLLVAVVGWFT